MLTTAGPKIQTLEKTVEAQTQDAAIHRALQLYPGMQFQSVAATSLEPQVIPPGQKPVLPQQHLPKQMAGMKPLQALQMPGQQHQHEGVDPRRFSYPYSIRLPVQFGRILQETSPVLVSEEYGQHQIILKNEADMRGFLDRLRTHRNRNYARIITEGIKSSGTAT